MDVIQVYHDVSYRDTSTYHTDVVRLRQQGLTLREIAARTGMSHETARQVLHKAGVERPVVRRKGHSRSYDADVASVVCEMWCEADSNGQPLMSSVDIGEALGLDKYAVRYLARRHGLRKRARGNSPPRWADSSN